MARSTKPLSDNDIFNAEHATAATAKQVTMVDAAGGSVMSSSGGGINVVPVNSTGGAMENTGAIIAASAARTANFDSTDLFNRGHNGIHVFLDVTVATSSAGLTVRIEAKDPASGSSGYFDMLGAATITSATVAKYSYQLYPTGNAPSTGAVGDITRTVPFALTDTYRIRVTTGSSDGVGSTRSWTYSIGRSLLL